MTIEAFHDLLAGRVPDGPCRYRFALEGTTYSVALRPEPDRFHYRIAARLGVRPYSAEDAAARRAVAEILDHCRSLERARFISDQHQAIWAVVDKHAAGPITPEAVVHETLLFLQEARPYIRVLADYA